MVNKSGRKSFLTKLELTVTFDKPETVRSDLSYYTGKGLILMIRFWSIASFTARIVSLLILSILIIFLIVATIGAPTIVDKKLFSMNSWRLYTVRDLSLIERISQRIQAYELVRVVLNQNQNNPQNEIDLLAQKLLPFKRLLLSQVQIKHYPTQNSALVWGLGFCDQVNAVAAMALAQIFDRVEMIGIQGTKSHGGHSFGRVWLPKMQEWVYFDLWPDDLFLLTVNKTSGVQILRRIDSSGIEKTHSLSGNSEFIKVYRDLAQAVPYLVFPKTALGYLVRSSIRDYLPHPTFNSVRPDDPSPESDTPSHEPLISKEVLKLYLAARQEQIFGNTNESIKLYNQFLNQAPPDSPFTKAATIFQASLVAKIT